jgi:hypothetical protein
VVKKSRSIKRPKCDVGQTPTIPKTHNPVTDVSATPTDSASALSTTTKSLELVEWRDANFYMEDQSFDGEYINATVGWTEEEDIWLKISSELTPDGDRAVTRVPLVNVVSRKSLATVAVTVASPSTWITSGVPTE